MKQVFHTGDLPKLSVVVIDGNFTEDVKGILKDEEIAKMKAHPDQSVFFRRYRSYMKAKS